jgi:hypothetical protein
MLYLLGGTPTSGKTAIAKRFLSEGGVPFFPLDYLMMGVARGLPEVGVDPTDDEFKVGELLWPIVKGMASQALVEPKNDYLMEGAQLRPRHAWELSEELPGRIRACFLGFAEIDTMEKLRQIRHFSGGEANRYDDFARWDDQGTISEIERLKAFSARLRAECYEYAMTYVEVSTDLANTADTVIRYLKG